MFQTIRPLLVVVGGSDVLTRRYCMEHVATRYRIALIDSHPPTWQKPFIVDHQIADLRDPTAIVTAGAALAARHTVAGILTWDEYALVGTSALTTHLDLPGSTLTATHAARDKAESRAKFAEHRVPSAISTRVHTLDEAIIAAQRTGYPVVLKPASHAASIGVIRVDSLHELPNAWQFTMAGAGDQGPEGHGVLVEEYLAGPEISVECATVDGVTTVLALTRKQIGFAPFFEETGHTVTATDHLLPTVAPVAQAAVRALGITHGVQHVEMRLTTTGPRIIEVNARIGGDMIGLLVRLATGLDLPLIAADIAAGQSPQLTATAQRTAAITILYPPTSGTLTARTLAIEPGPQHPWLHQIAWQREVGDQVTLPPDGNLDLARIGFAIVTADDLHTAHDHIDRLTDHLTLTVTPRTIPGQRPGLTAVSTYGSVHDFGVAT